MSYVTVCGGCQAVTQDVRAERLRCDGCGLIPEASKRWPLPDGWLEVYVGKDDEPDRHYCSATCIVKGFQP